MSKRDQLIAVMREFGLQHVYVDKCLDFDAELPSGTILLPVPPKAKLEVAVYKVFTPDGWICDEQVQDLTLLTVTPDESYFNNCRRICTEDISIASE